MAFAIKNIIPGVNSFYINRSSLENRLDPIYYGSDLAKFNSSKFNSVSISSIVSSMKSGIGAGKQDQTDESGVIQIRPTNMDENGLLKFDRNVYLPENDKIETLYIDDIIFNNTNSQELVGKTAILKDNLKLYFSNHITRIRVKKEIVLPEYLWIILNLYQKNKIFYSICTNWNNQSGVGLELLKNLKIPLPPLPIQKEIVAIYNKAYQDKLQKEQKAKNLLDNIDIYLLDELGIELPQELISLEKRIFTTSLSELTGSRFDPDYLSKKKYLLGRNSKYEFTNFKNILLKSPQYGANEEAIEGIKNEGVRYIRITDIDEFGNLKNDTWKTASTINENYILEFNDILIARTGATVGKSYIFKEEKLEAIFAGYMIRFVIDTNKANPDFVFYYLNCKFYKYWISAIQRPSAQPNINSQEYKSLPFVLPPINKQNEIALNIFKIREEAKRLKEEANKMLENAKVEVEKIILG
jgi:restriction endonuclease S subunit